MDSFRHVLSRAGFKPMEWEVQPGSHANVRDLAYWQGEEPSRKYTSLVIDGIEDHGAIQLEEAALLYALVRAFKPRLVVETGCNVGLSSSAIAIGLADNDRGALVTCDIDARWVEMTGARLVQVFDKFCVIRGDGVSAIREVANKSLAAGFDGSDGGVQMFFHDSLHTEENILAEFNAVKPMMPVGAIAAFHDLHVVWDAGTTLDEMTRAVLRIERENPGWRGIFTPSCPGLYVMQRQR